MQKFDLGTNDESSRMICLFSSAAPYNNIQLDDGGDWYLIISSGGGLISSRKSSGGWGGTSPAKNNVTYTWNYK